MIVSDRKGKGKTPILPCLGYHLITSKPSGSADPSSSSSTLRTHPLWSPTFDIPDHLLSPIETASIHLKSGDTVAIPTETVYGLAANTLNPTAVSKIYEIKNRPSDNPLIIHVSSLKMLSTLLSPTYQPSRLYNSLISRFWPGPLTLLFPAPAHLIKPPPHPQTIGIRMPNHPLILALISHCNLPLSAPSANSSGRPSPTTAEHVWNDLNGKEGLGCILDGGPCQVGVESTVLNALGWKEGGGGEVKVLRPGGVEVEDIAEVLKEVDGNEGSTRIIVNGKEWKPPMSSTSTSKLGTKSQLHIGGADSSKQGGNHRWSNGVSNGTIKKEEESHPSTPGMKYRHYSPRIPVYLIYPSNSFPSNPIIEVQSNTTEISDVISRAVHHDSALNSRSKQPTRIGVLHYEGSPLYHAFEQSEKKVITSEVGPFDIKYLSLGSNSTSAAQKLFGGLLQFEGKSLNSPDHINGSRDDLSSGTYSDTAAPEEITADNTEEGVDVILVEACTNEGMGLAFMERVNKAVGGGGRSGNLSNGEHKEGSNSEGEGRFWVRV